MPGVRDAPFARTAEDELVVGNLLTLKYTRELLAKRPPPYSVLVEDGGVCCKTRPDRRHGMVFCPIHDFRQRGPIGFVLQQRCARLRTSDNQAVKAVRQQFANIFVVMADILAASLRARNLRHREKPHPNQKILRRLSQQIAELTLSGLQRGVGHVVDEPDHDRGTVAEVQPACDIPQRNPGWPLPYLDHDLPLRYFAASSA